MPTLHKGRLTPRASPIDWVSLFWYRDQQPLYVDFRTSQYPDGHSIDTSIHGSPHVIAKAVAGDEGDFSYTWQFDDWFSVQIKIKLTTYLLSGVENYRFRMQGLMDDVVVNEWIWDQQPGYNLEAFSWGIVPWISTFNTVPTLWSAIPASVMRAVQWVDVPP